MSALPSHLVMTKNICLQEGIEGEEEVEEEVQKMLSRYFFFTFFHFGSLLVFWPTLLISSVDVVRRRILSTMLISTGEILGRSILDHIWYLIFWYFREEYFGQNFYLKWYFREEEYFGQSFDLNWYFREEERVVREEEERRSSVEEQRQRLKRLEKEYCQHMERYSMIVWNCQKVNSYNSALKPLLRLQNSSKQP